MDIIESDEEENLMNGSDKEFVERSVVENKNYDMHEDEKPEITSNDAHSNLIPTHLPIQAVVRRDFPEEESRELTSAHSWQPDSNREPLKHDPI